MSDPGIVVRGGDDLAKAFEKLADDIKGPALRVATRAAALPIFNQAKKTVPEGGNTPYKTGTLRRSIHMETVETSPDRCTVQVGTDVPYARRLEYGFFDIDSLGRMYNQIPQPYMRPALDENTEVAKEEFRAAVADIVARRGGRAD